MSQNPPTDREIGDKLQALFDALDAQRSEGLRELRDVQTAKSSVLEQEKQRLSYKLGSDHPRVKSLNDQLVLNQGILDDLERLIRKVELESGGLSDSLTPAEIAGRAPPQEPPGPDAWVVQGTVVDRDGRGVSGLTVDLYDKDLLFDDHLGSAITGRGGAFRVVYRTADFRDLFERNPDLYLRVTDYRGRELFPLERAVRYSAGRVETFKVSIDPLPDDNDDD